MGVFVRAFSALCLACCMLGVSAGNTSDTPVPGSGAQGADILPTVPNPTDPLFLRVYNDLFVLEDGSKLVSANTRALNTMRAGVQRLLAVGSNEDLLSVARGLPDHVLLRILFLAVAGQFSVGQSQVAFLQKCALIVDASTGELVLRDSRVTQSVILEVLLIVSIICLLKAWGWKQ